MNINEQHWTADDLAVLFPLAAQVAVAGAAMRWHLWRSRRCEVASRKHLIAIRCNEPLYAELTARKAALDERRLARAAAADR